MTATTATLLFSTSPLTGRTAPARRRHHAKGVSNVTPPGQACELVTTATRMPSALQSIMSRPQIGIERLPTRRLTNEPRESMNCKSCRKRKIKCNRLRPSCEACQVFQCTCVYDAVPKKRGPKTDVLEALLKRVDGLEAQLKDKKGAPRTLPSEITPSTCGKNKQAALPEKKGQALSPTDRISNNEHMKRPEELVESVECSLSPSSEPSPHTQPDALLNTYFSRFHAKPFYILDEASLRRRMQLNQIPAFLAHAIYAVAARYAHFSGDRQTSPRLSEDYAAQARAEIDTDEPSIEALQALLLLVVAFTASGKCKKAYMLLTTVVGMVMVLELHREMDANARATPVEREMRRRLFWSCYLMDTFLTCGSKRPSLISDEMILLRLPCWSPSPASLPVDGDFFQSATILQAIQGAIKKAQGSSGLLIDITRILGITSRYLALGGLTGDSHFPWHSLSSLSKIRQELDAWVLGVDNIFSSIESLFSQPDATVLVLGKLIYHLIHCLIYRPFLPINLAELARSGQYQCWQVEATNMCFAHANAIAELVAFGMQNASMEWPAFTAYCICTAGTVHIHGIFYGEPSNAAQMAVFGSSQDFLNRAMQQLEELQSAWTSVQTQREMLQSLRQAHSVLVRNTVDSETPESAVFHQEDFFDRYLCVGELNGHGFSFDTANLCFSDVVPNSIADACGGYSKTHATGGKSKPSPNADAGRPKSNRRNKGSSLVSSGPRRSEHQAADSHMPTHNLLSPDTVSLPTPPSYAQGFSTFQASSISSPQASPEAIQVQMARPSPSEARSSHASPPECPDRSAVINKEGGMPLAPVGFTIVASSLSPGVITQIPTQTLPKAQLGHQTANSIQQQRPGSGHHYPQQQPPLLSVLTPPPAAQDGENDLQAFNDPMFGVVPTGSFQSPTPWRSDDAVMRPMVGEPNKERGGGSNSGKNANGSQLSGSGTGIGACEEKDPFLSLLEQLAESELAQGLGELDMFLGSIPEAC